MDYRSGPRAPQTAPQTGKGAEVYIVDTDEAFRQALSSLLDAAGIASHAYGSALEFLLIADQLAPGCIITDVRTPGVDGIELVRHLRQMGLPHPVIVVTGHGDILLAVDAMKAGAIDFIEKPFDEEVFLHAVRSALDVEDRASRQDAARREVAELLAVLSPREQEVLHGVVAGKSNKVVAQELGISPRTVEAHRANLMTKTGTAGLSELVRMALIAGIEEVRFRPFGHRH